MRCLCIWKHDWGRQIHLPGASLGPAGRGLSPHCCLQEGPRWGCLGFLTWQLAFLPETRDARKSRAEPHAFDLALEVTLSFLQCPSDYMIRAVPWGRGWPTRWVPGGRGHWVWLEAGHCCGPHGKGGIWAHMWLIDHGFSGLHICHTKKTNQDFTSPTKANVK